MLFSFKDAIDFWLRRNDIERSWGLVKAFVFFYYGGGLFFSEVGHFVGEFFV